MDWLHLQRPVLLKEITPDNSWVFLVQVPVVPGAESYKSVIKRDILSN